MMMCRNVGELESRRGTKKYHKKHVVGRDKINKKKQGKRLLFNNKKRLMVKVKTDKTSSHTMSLLKTAICTYSHI